MSLWNTKNLPLVLLALQMLAIQSINSLDDAQARQPGQLIARYDRNNKLINYEYIPDDESSETLRMGADDIQTVIDSVKDFGHRGNTKTSVDDQVSTREGSSQSRTSSSTSRNGYSDSYGANQNEWNQNQEQEQSEEQYDREEELLRRIQQRLSTSNRTFFAANTFKRFLKLIIEKIKASLFGNLDYHPDYY